MRVFSVDVLVKVASIVLLPLYLALMSQDDYAAYNYLVSLIGVLALVFNFGLYVPQSKLFHDVAKHQQCSLLLTINLLLAFFLLLGLGPTYWLGWDRVVFKALFSLSIDYEKYRYLVPFGVITTVYAQMILNYLLTREDVGRVQAFNLARLTLGSALTLGALYEFVGNGAEVRLAAFLIAECVAIAVMLVYYIKQMRGRFNSDLAKASLRLGLPIMVSGTLGIVINFGDKYFVGKYCTLSELSVYFLGLTFAGVITAVSMAFQNVWLPSFLKEVDLVLNLARTRRAAFQLAGVFALISTGIWLAVAIALRIGVINASYKDVLVVLPIQLMSTTCAGLVGLLSSFTIYWSMTHVTIVIGVVIAIASVPLNLLAVSAFGIVGAASVSVAVNLMYGAAYITFIRRQSAALQARLA